MFFFYRVVLARNHRTTALVAGAVAHAFRIVWQVKVTHSHFILRPHTSALNFIVFCSPFSFSIVLRVSAAPSAFDRPMQGALGQATGVYFYLPPFRSHRKTSFVTVPWREAAVRAHAIPRCVFANFYCKDASANPESNCFSKGMLIVLLDSYIYSKN